MLIINIALPYELIYQLDAIEYLFVYFQLDMFRAYTSIFRSNSSATRHQHTHSSRPNLTTPKTPYAVYVKKL